MLLRVGLLVVVVLSSSCGTTSGVDGGGGGGSGGNSGTGGGGGGGPALAIVTETLGSGRIGVAYSQPLSASGGVGPYGWVIVSKSPSFTWLTIGSNTGTLSGLPATAGTGSVVVAVTDQNAVTISKEFSLQIDACQSGSTVACAVPIGGGCSVGTQTCVNGELSGACSGALSTDVSRCGPSCGACDPVTADRCAAGVCACGGGAACGVGQACCGGVCKSLDDPRSCGACANDCTSMAGQNVTASCSSRQCAFACSAPNFNHCVGNTSVPPTAGVACETDVALSVDNCGSCGHGCAPLSNSNTVAPGGVSCSSGQCRITCALQFLNCNGATEDGCEVPFSVMNCGSCGNVCQAGANATTTCTSGACVFSCVSPRIHCGSPLGNNVACETDPTNDWNNCGGCGRRCASDKADNCTGGQCRCGANAACGAGLRCVGGACICDTQSGCAGCCVGGTTCAAGTSGTSCGEGGVTCASCSSLVCEVGPPVVRGFCDSSLTPRQCGCL
ncbi:MAG: Ig domain-containing protein [Myxococcota bacterium]